MSALAMILTAAMVIPGDRPEKVSGEVAENQRLDLSGEWEGFWWFDHNTRFEAHSKCPSGQGHLMGRQFAIVCRGNCNLTAYFIDEGQGHLCGEWELIGPRIHGIYRQEGTKLLICFTELASPCPTSFRAGEGRHLLILHRVKSRK